MVACICDQSYNSALKVAQLVIMVIGRPYVCSSSVVSDYGTRSFTDSDR